MALSANLADTRVPTDLCLGGVTVVGTDLGVLVAFGFPAGFSDVLSLTGFASVLSLTGFASVPVLRDGNCDLVGSGEAFDVDLFRAGDFERLVCLLERAGDFERLVCLPERAGDFDRLGRLWDDLVRAGDLERPLERDLNLFDVLA